MERIEIIIRLLQRCIILGMVLLVCTNAKALDLTGTWTGACYNNSYQKQGNIEATLIQNGNVITGHLTVYKPLYGSGLIEGWIDIEDKKFGASIKCKSFLPKILMGGQTTYLENASIDIKEDLSTGQMLGEIKGDYRCDFGWARDQAGTFRITRIMQEGFGDIGTVEENTSPVYTTKHSNVYHKSNCPELGTGDLIEFSSTQQAREAGGTPCKNCNP